MAHLCRHMLQRGIPSQLVLRAADQADYVHPRSNISLANSFPDVPTQRLSLENAEHDLENQLSQTKSSIAYVHLDMYHRYAHIFEDLSVKTVLYAGRSADRECLDLKRSAERGHVIGIVSISSNQARSFRDLLSCDKLLSRVPVSVIRQGTYCYKSSTEADYIESVVPKSRRVVVSIGATRPYKQIDHFIRLIDGLHHSDSNTLGVFVGPITKKWLDVNSADYAVTIDPNTGVIRINNVLFVGPSFHIGNWLERASLCVCTSTEYEGIPGFLRESMLCGCPVVSYEVGSVAELIRSGWNGETVELGNEAQLMCTSFSALSKSSRNTAITKRAQRFVKMFFSARRHKAETESLLAKLGYAKEIFHTAPPL